MVASCACLMHGGACLKQSVCFLLLTGRQVGSSACLTSGLGRPRFMHLVGSKRAASLSQLWLTSHGLLTGGTCHLALQTLWSTFSTSGIMARSHASLFRRTRSEYSRLFGTKHHHTLPPYHRTLILESTNIHESAVMFWAELAAQKRPLQWHSNVPQKDLGILFP
jgi:hypothetical protein